MQRLIVATLAESPKSRGEALLVGRPVGRVAVARVDLERGMEGGDGVVQVRIVAPLAEHPQRHAEAVLGLGPIDRIGATRDQRQRRVAIKRDRVRQSLRLDEPFATVFEHLGLLVDVAPATMRVVGRQLARCLCVSLSGAQVVELQRLHLRVRSRDLGFLALGLGGRRDGGLDARPRCGARLFQQVLGVVDVACVDGDASILQQRRGGGIVLLLLQRKPLVERIDLVGPLADQRNHLAEVEAMAARQLDAHLGAHGRQRPLRDVLVGGVVLHLNLDDDPLRRRDPSSPHLVGELRMSCVPHCKRAAHHGQRQKPDPHGSHQPPEDARPNDPRAGRSA